MEFCFDAKISDQDRLEVPTFMKKSVDPNIKLLLIVRDPVKRLVSDYNQFRTKNLDQNQTYPDLEELVFTADGNQV